MSDQGKSPLQRVVDGDQLQAGDVRAAIADLLARIEDLEKVPKKSAPKKVAL